MKCENCANNPIKSKPNATQLASWMTPTGPWLSFFRWTFFIGVVITMLFYVVIEPQTGLNIYYGFVPLFFSVLALSLLVNVLVFSQGPFICKICGHTQQLQELQELNEACRRCKGHKFLRIWNYPFWVKISTVLLAFSSVVGPGLFVVYFATMSSIFIYVGAAVAGIWLILFFIIDIRSAVYKKLLFKGSDMILTLRCTDCGTRQ